MKDIIKLSIECGEKTCASEPGKFCEFFKYHIINGQGTCILFGSLKEKNGWILRHKECLKYSN